jgi:hypothetical protein
VIPERLEQRVPRLCAIEAPLSVCSVPRAAVHFGQGEVRDLMEALRRSIDERAGKKPTVKEAPARAEAPARKRIAREAPAAQKSVKRARSA